MIKKIKHPKGRGERLAIKTKKARIGSKAAVSPLKRLHSNASPVYKLLKEREDYTKTDLDLDIKSQEGKIT